ncbi:MAG: cation-translocating P-type ATPase C-terminal domain-containing protein, partial [Candidatus Woesearchaeota archaeon]|nr:cation-translocating P-type ATPase C-terminal domain-containing protein [Candidatus Woesearchaeota archaeon]
MKRKPRSQKENIINAKDAFVMVIIGISVMAITLYAFRRYLPDLKYARTIAFTTIVMLQLFNVLYFRSLNKSIFTKGLFSNKYLVAAVLFSVALQAAVLYTPLNSMFQVVPISLADWGIVLGLSVIVLVVGEALKIVLYGKSAFSDG